MHSISQLYELIATCRNKITRRNKSIRLRQFSLSPHPPSLLLQLVEVSLRVDLFGDQGNSAYLLHREACTHMVRAGESKYNP